MSDKYVLVKRREITPELRQAVLRRDNFTCRYCGSKREPLHLDHVYPVAKGGETSEENLVTSCLRCNVKKHAKTGIFPKPIGCFEKKPESPEISILILLLGLFLVSTGFMQGEVFVSKTMTLFGISTILVSVGRLVTGKS